MSEIKFRDLGRQYQSLKEQIDRTVLNVLADGQYIGGSYVLSLEKALADYVGVKHCISCANGTDALLLLLIAFEIGKGDAVFVPDFTFFATAEMIPVVGATPVYVDVERETFNMDPLSLEKAIVEVMETTPLRPAAVIPVDLFGLPADFDRIISIAKRYDLRIIEDAAQGFGGTIENRRAGSFGDAAITSFFPAKPLGCYGDGGAIFTNDDNLAGLLNSLKVHGKGNHKYVNIRIGMNSRLDTLQAAILSVKFPAFTEYELQNSSRVRDLYTNRLDKAVDIPLVPEGYSTSNAQYTIKLPNESMRDSLQLYLKQQNIPTMVYYPIPLHKQLALQGLGLTPVDLDTTEKLCETVLSLPIHPYLSQNEVELVAREVLGWVRRSK